VGSSDLLSNPVKLMGKIGLGFYELAKDPIAGIV